jgi:hypothetical protein
MKLLLWDIGVQQLIDEEFSVSQWSSCLTVTDHIPYNVTQVCIRWNKIEYIWLVPTWVFVNNIFLFCKMSFNQHPGRTPGVSIAPRTAGLCRFKTPGRQRLWLAGCLMARQLFALIWGRCPGLFLERFAADGNCRVSECSIRD